MIVVGAGSAGCAAAAVLAGRTNLTVALVEAGPDYGVFDRGNWPSELLDPRVMPSSHDWDYVETRAGELQPERRAKVVGGCSTHNQCAAVWGQPADYDWADGWTYVDLERAIAEVDAAIAPEPHPDGTLASWQRNFIAAAETAGYERLANGSARDGREGVGPFSANIRGTVRWNASFAFLDAARGRGNLSILGETLVDRLVVTDGVASVVACRTHGRETELRARWFVLSAGAYGSPAILLRSGIGGREQLEALGIAVEVELDGVGRNLHDHCGVDVEFRPSPSALAQLDEDLELGRLSQSQVVLRAASRFAAQGWDLHVLPFQSRSESGAWSFRIFAFNMAPFSRGTVTLAVADPSVRPTIDFAFVTDSAQRDLAALCDALAIARRVAAAEPLAGAIAEEVQPGADAPVEEQVAARVTGYAHAVGTCALGDVVEGDCRVRGTRNVFVADAAIIPRIPRANTNLTCHAIGLHAAKCVLDEIGQR